MSTTELSQYEAMRQALIQEDRALRADNRESFTELEISADQAIRELRAKEAKSLWANEHPSIPHPFPGMEFLTGIEISFEIRLFSRIYRKTHHSAKQTFQYPTADAERRPSAQSFGRYRRYAISTQAWPESTCHACSSNQAGNCFEPSERVAGISCTPRAYVFQRQKWSNT